MAYDRAWFRDALCVYHNSPTIDADDPEVAFEGKVHVTHAHSYQHAVHLMRRPPKPFRLIFTDLLLPASSDREEIRDAEMQFGSGMGDYGVHLTTQFLASPCAYGLGIFLPKQNIDFMAPARERLGPLHFFVASTDCWINEKKGIRDWVKMYWLVTDAINNRISITVE